MSNPIAGYAIMPIVPSLRGLDAEINRQLAGSGAFAAAGTKAGTAFNSGFARSGAQSQAAGAESGSRFSEGFVGAAAAAAPSRIFNRLATETGPVAAAAGAQVGAEFSAAVVTQLATLPKAQADRLRTQLRQEALAARQSSAAAAVAGRSWGEKFRDGVQTGIGDLGDIGLDASALTSFGTKALLVGGVAAVGLGKAAKSAGDLNAAVSTSEQVFGASQGAVEKWSENAADSIYVSQRAALEAATSFGAFGKSAGLVGPELASFSTDLTDLAGDLAAFKNTDPSEALAALQSGLAGESEPLRRYNILLSDAQLRQEALRLGIVETTSQALTPQQRVLAANASIWAQSADMIGQAGREYDEVGSQINRAAANMEDASAAFGEGLAPFLAAGAGGLADLAGAFQSLDRGTKGTASAVAGAVTTVTLLGGAASLAAGSAMKLSDGYQRLKLASDNSNKAIANSATVGRGAAKVLGAAGLAFAVYELGQALDEASKDAVGFETALNNIKNAAADANIDAYIADLAKSESGWIDTTNDVWNNIGNLGMGGPDTLQIGEYAVEFDELASALKKAKDAGADDQLARMLERIGEAEPPEFNSWFDAENEGAWTSLQDSIAGYEEYLKSLREEAGGLNTEQGQQQQEFDNSKAAADALTKAVDGLGRRTALASLEFDAASAGADAFAASLERSTSVGNLLGASLGVSSAMRDLKAGFYGEADAAGEASTKTDSLTRTLDQMNRALEWSDPALSKTAIGMGRLSAEAAGFREAMSGNSYASQIGSALDLGDAFRDFSKQMRRLPDEIDVAGAALGKYRPRQTEAIRAMLQLGEATGEYLAGLLESGKGSAYVRSEADRLRNSYIEQLRAAGKNEEQIRSYIEALGLTPEQVETSIKLSGVEGARFEIQSYLQLLEGRIPESVAASVTALISSGDLEGAADTLAALAASNPVVIPVGLDDDELSRAKEELIRFPKMLDPLGPIFGNYTEEEERGLEAILALADQTKGALSEMVAAGRPEGDVLAVAGQMRDQWRGVFEEMTGSNEAFDGYIEKLLGLDSNDIKIGIDVASFESDVFKINTLLGLLEADMTSEDRFAIAAKIRTGDLDGAMDELDRVLANQKFLDIVANLGPVTTATAEFIDGLRGTEVDIPVGAETRLAFEGVDSFRSDILSSFNFVNVAANMNPANVAVDEFGIALYGRPSYDLKVGADTSIAEAQIDAMLKRQAVIAVQLGGSPSGDQSGLKRAAGGYVSGAGTATSDSIMAWLSNGEYVLQASAVRDIGVDTLDRLNRGDIDLLQRDSVIRGVQSSTSSGGSPAVTLDVGGINYHQVERAPTARDMVRDIDTELLMLTGRRFGR